MTRGMFCHKIHCFIRFGLPKYHLFDRLLSNIQSTAMTPDAHFAALNAIPLKRFGQPAEVADAAVFLATNKYASNCVLNLDGGLSAI